MKRDIVLIENRIKSLRLEMQKIKRQRIENAGKICVKYFTKEVDFTNENLVKFAAEFKAFLEVKNAARK